MLLNRFSLDERAAFRAATIADDDGPIRDVINAAVWRRLLDRWDQVIWRFWILKTLRYRDLEGVWVKLFGPRPQ